LSLRIPNLDLPPAYESKELFGEVAMAKKFARMVAEIELKAWVYTLMMNLPPAPALSAVRS